MNFLSVFSGFGCRASLECTSDLPKPNIVSLKRIEYGFGYIIITSPHTPYSIYLRGTMPSPAPKELSKGFGAHHAPTASLNPNPTLTWHDLSWFSLAPSNPQKALHLRSLVLGIRV